MNNKLIRTLVIINGILIPIVILTFFGIFLVEYIQSRQGWHTDLNNDITYEYVVKYSSPQEIVNSENHYVAKYKVLNVDELTFDMKLEFIVPFLPSHPTLGRNNLHIIMII